MRGHLTKKKLAELVAQQTPEVRALMRSKTHTPERALDHFLKQPEAQHLSGEQLENIAAYLFGQFANVSYDMDAEHVIMTPKAQHVGTFGARAPVAKGSPAPEHDATEVMNVPAGLKQTAAAKRGKDLPTPDEAKIAKRKQQELDERKAARNPFTKRVSEVLPLWPTKKEA